jgi:transmembrane sensor
MEPPAADSEKLFEEALDLIIRLQNDPGNPVARDLMRNWRARGPEHEAAWAEAAEIHGMAGKVLEDRRNADSARNTVSRRKVMLGGFAGLALAGAAAFYGPDLLARLRADHVTSTAEIRRITLADGTIVTLGPESAIRTVSTERLRQVDLLSGMAFFEVVPDPARPFEATAGHLRVTVLGTAFDLSSNAGSITVAVDHGLVRVNVAESAQAEQGTLADGQWLTLDEGSQQVGRGTHDPGQVAAWRDGMIVADSETVSSLVATIGRWHTGRILIADPWLGARQISGVFDLKDPVKALEAVVLPYGGAVRQLSPWLTVISPI